MATTLAPTFGPGKIFIKASDDNEWKEIGAVVSDGISLSSDSDDNQRLFEPMGEFSFTFTMRKRTRIRMLQQCGILDKPKCTYKTIRRDCAKRNRR